LPGAYSHVTTRPAKACGAGFGSHRLGHPNVGRIAPQRDHRTLIGDSVRMRHAHSDASGRLARAVSHAQIDGYGVRQLAPGFQMLAAPADLIKA
jgi:hypothetical protein